MKMIITMKELIDIKPSIDKLLTFELPVQIAFNYLKLADLLVSNVKKFDEVKDKLLKKTAIPKVDQPGQYTFETPEKMQEFKDEYDELLSIEISLDDIQPISLVDLGNIKLTLSDMTNLKHFIRNS